jgi:hypothetical protein
MHTTRWIEIFQLCVSIISCGGTLPLTVPEYRFGRRPEPIKRTQAGVNDDSQPGCTPHARKELVSESIVSRFGRTAMTVCSGI